MPVGISVYNCVDFPSIWTEEWLLSGIVCRIFTRIGNHLQYIVFNTGIKVHVATNRTSLLFVFL